MTSKAAPVHATLADKAYNAKSRKWVTLGKYKNPNTAGTIKGMIHSARGLAAFAQYPSHTFEARIIDLTVVQFRRRIAK